MITLSNYPRTRILVLTLILLAALSALPALAIVWIIRQVFEWTAAWWDDVKVTWRYRR
jgi:hypothetical protein